MFFPSRMTEAHGTRLVVRGRAFVGRCSTALAVMLAGASLATSRVAHGEPAYGVAPAPPAKARSAPSCPMLGMSYLPARELFERAEGPRQADAIAAGIMFREQRLFVEREQAATEPPRKVGRNAAFERALPGFSLELGRLSRAPKGKDGGREPSRLVSASASLAVPLPWGRDFRLFVDRHRELFGIRADPRVRVVEAENESIRLKYPNGAMSDGRVVAFDTGYLEGCHLHEEHTFHNISNDLHEDEPYLSAAPAVSAEEAVRRFQDIAPYVAIDTQEPVRLVIVTGRTGGARLVWRVAYHYDCLWWYAHKVLGITTNHFHAELDAFSGSLL